MSTLEDIYARLEKNKKRRKEINKMLKDELSHSTRYQEITEEMKTLREEKKGIEQEVRAGNSDIAELEELKAEIQTDQELLADQALNMYVKQETVEIKDEYDQTWYPVFKVNFKKSN
jgi:predicted  nucleic acid-binding Zn-ribbon protein